MSKANSTYSSAKTNYQNTTTTNTKLNAKIQYDRKYRHETKCKNVLKQNIKSAVAVIGKQRKGHGSPKVKKELSYRKQIARQLRTQ